MHVLLMVVLLVLLSLMMMMMMMLADSILFSIESWYVGYLPSEYGILVRSISLYTEHSYNVRVPTETGLLILLTKIALERGEREAVQMHGGVVHEYRTMSLPSQGGSTAAFDHQLEIETAFGCSQPFCFLRLTVLSFRYLRIPVDGK